MDALAATTGWLPWAGPGAARGSAGLDKASASFSDREMDDMRRVCFRVGAGGSGLSPLEEGASSELTFGASSTS